MDLDRSSGPASTQARFLVLTFLSATPFHRPIIQLAPLFLLSSLALLPPNPLQKLRIPPLAHIRMTPHAVRQGRLAQMPPAPLPERKLHIIPPQPAPLRHNLVPHPQHLGGDVHGLKRAIVAHALEEGHAVPRPGARGGREHAVGGGFADAVRERLEALPDRYHQGAREGRDVDPVAREVLRLEPRVVGGLQEV